MAAAETAKSPAPMTVLVRCTNSFTVSADRRCRRPVAAEARTQSSARYDGARPCRHLKTTMASLNVFAAGQEANSGRTDTAWRYRPRLCVASRGKKCNLYIGRKQYNKNTCIGDDTKAAAHQSQNCIFKNKKNKIWRKKVFNKADGTLTPCNLHDRDIDFARRLHPAMWHVPVKSSQWILHQVAAPCKFYPNWTTLGRKKWHHVDFQDGGFQSSWILGVQ